MSDHTIEMADGRTVGYADFGPPDGIPVLWSHGGPGSRIEPKTTAPAAAELGFRLIGVDRPAYGLSTPQIGRTIRDWVGDAEAVANDLGVDRFFAVGVSTGGAYALATAAELPDRVRGVVACCALTDLRNAEARAAVVGMTSWGRIFETRDRNEAIAIALDQFGEDGSKMAAAPNASGIALADADVALFTDPTYLGTLLETFPPMFAHGVRGYADDRLADGPGWGSFDVTKVTAPVTVLHGNADTICPVINAHTTAALIPDAVLKITPDDGHFSVVRHVPEVLAEMLHA